MDVQTVLHIMQGTESRFNEEDAAAFVSYCAERGLTPFAESYPLLFISNGKRNLSFKDHYSVQSRWAHVEGGYRKARKHIETEDGSTQIQVEIIPNRDYAIVLKAVELGADRVEEMEAYTCRVVGIVTKAEKTSKKYPPKGKTWEWLAEKRATEDALRQMFGKEPSQVRQILAISAQDRNEAVHALYGSQAPRQALAAPVESQVVEGVIVKKLDDEAPGWDDEGEDNNDLWDQEEQAESEELEELPSFVADTVKVLMTQKNTPYLMFTAGEDAASWFKSRDELLKAAPWIGTVYTKDDFQPGSALPLSIRVEYEVSGQYRNAVAFAKA